MLKSIEIESIAEWFERAVPLPAPKNVQTQIGVHFEEVGEMLTTLTSTDPDINTGLKQLGLGMARLATLVKERGSLRIKMKPDNRIDLLDALCDQVVTAIGVGHMLGYDITGALGEVNASNWSKFLDGAPVFDENKKIQKGPNYFPPRLGSFLTPA